MFKWEALSTPSWQAALAAVAVLWAAGCACRWLRMWSVARRLPGPRAWPVIGNATAFLRGPEGTFRTIRELFVNHGPVVRLWFGPKLVVAISSPGDAQRILNHPKVINRDHHVVKATNAFIDNSLITVKSDVARARRKLMAPAFHFNILKTYVEVFARKGEEMCKRLAAVADGRTVNIKDELSILTLDAILETVVGVNMDYTLTQWQASRDLIDNGMALVFKRLRKPWLLIDWLYALTQDGRTIKAIRQSGTQKVQDAFTKKRQIASGNTATTPTFSKTKLQSFSDIILDAVAAGEDVLTEDEIREECFILAGAGMDTTASTLAYALILLGMHPTYQDSLLDEQHSIFDNSLRPVTHEDLVNMPLLDQITKETLRLFPPVSLLPREIPEDIEISGGRVLPAGCSAFISNYCMQRDAANFEQPERFWPERWLPQNSAGRHAYAFLPFSAGARNCIGMKYAQLQIKATLSRVLREFRFTSGYSMEELSRIKLSVSNISVLGYDVQVFVRDKFCVHRRGDQPLG